MTAAASTGRRYAVADLVATAPPLTADQVDRLRRLLPPVAPRRMEGEKAA